MNHNQHTNDTLNVILPTTHSNDRHETLVTFAGTRGTNTNNQSQAAMEQYNQLPDDEESELQDLSYQEGGLAAFSPAQNETKPLINQLPLYRVDMKGLYQHKTDRNGLTSSRGRLQKENDEKLLEEDLGNFMPQTVSEPRIARKDRARRNAVFVGSYEDLMKQLRAVKDLPNWTQKCEEPLEDYTDSDEEASSSISSDDEEEFYPERNPSPRRRYIRRNGIIPVSSSDFSITMKAKPISRQSTRRNGITHTQESAKQISEWLKIKMSDEEKMETLRLFKLIQNARRRGGKMFTDSEIDAILDPKIAAITQEEGSERPYEGRATEDMTQTDTNKVSGQSIFNLDTARELSSLTKEFLTTVSPSGFTDRDNRPTTRKHSKSPPSSVPDPETHRVLNKIVQKLDTMDRRLSTIEKKHSFPSE